jgi:hypothetical protein
MMPVCGICQRGKTKSADGAPICTYSHPDRKRKRTMPRMESDVSLSGGSQMFSDVSSNHWNLSHSTPPGTSTVNTPADSSSEFMNMLGMDACTILLTISIQRRNLSNFFK